MNKISSHFGLEYCVKTKTSLPPEVEEGNVEYKLKIKPLDDRRRVHLTSQLLWRLTEYGECRYMIGVDDDGIIEGIFLDELENSILELKKMVQDVGAEIVSEHREKITKRKPFLFASEILIKLKNGTTPSKEPITNASFVKIAFLGPTGAGKSSLISLLSSGDPTILDNGNGSARLSLLRHRHELLSGQSSSLSISYVPWIPSNNSGINQWKSLPLSPISPLSPMSLQHRSDLLTVRRLSQLIDLPGDVKFQKVSLSSLCSWSSPDWVVVQLAYDPMAISTSSFPSSALKDIFALVAGLEFSCFIIINKIDLATSSMDLLEYELLIKDCFTEVKKSLFQVCDTEYQSRWYREREQLSLLQRQKMEASLRKDLDPLPCMQSFNVADFDAIGSKVSTKLALQGPTSTQSIIHPSSLSLFKVSCVSGDGIENLMRHFSRLKCRRPLRLLNHLSSSLDCLIEGIMVVETTQLLSQESQWILGGSILDGWIDLSLSAKKKAFIGPLGDGGGWMEIPSIAGMEVMGILSMEIATIGRIVTLSIPSTLLQPTKGMLLLFSGDCPPVIKKKDSFNADVSLSLIGGEGIDPFDEDGLSRVKEIFETQNPPLSLKGSLYMMGRRWVCSLNSIQSLYLSSRMDASFTIITEDIDYQSSVLPLPIPGSRIVYVPNSFNFRLQGNIK